jgi:hypothetical protein
MRDSGLVAGMPFRVVIAGLDPAIHAAMGLAFTARFSSLPFRMDHRVKPGGDEVVET